MELTDTQRREVDKHFSANLQVVGTGQETKYYIQLHSPLGLNKIDIDKESYDALRNSKESVATKFDNSVSLKSETAARIAVNLFPEGTFSDFEYLYAQSKPTPETQYSGQEAQSSVALAR